MSIIKKISPLPTAGDTCLMTLAARPQNKMSAEKTNLARNLARDGHDHVEIASLLDKNEDAILQALAALRTRNPRASRKSLNSGSLSHSNTGSAG